MRWKLAVLAALLTVATSNRLRADELRIAELVKDLRNGNAEQRWQAARLLGTRGAEARPAALYLTIALRDEDRTVRYYAARALASIGPAVGDIAGANLLHAAQNDSNRFVREEAGAALRAVDPTPLFLKVPWLYANLDGKPEDVMSEFRVRRYKPIEELVTQLQQKDVELRRDAAGLLARLRWRAAPAATALSAALRDKDESVRFFAAQALKEIGPSAYFISKENLLHVASNDPAKRVREQAEQTLQSLLNGPVDVLETDEILAESILFITRYSLRKELPPTRDRLTQQVVSEDLTQRRKATWKLARVRPTDHLTQRYLCSALVDDDEIVRYNAVTALGRIGLAAGPFAVSSLDVVRLGETSQRVLHRAILAKFLTDPDFPVDYSDNNASPKTERRPVPNKEPGDLPPDLKSRTLSSWLLRLHDADISEQILAIRKLGKLGIRGRNQLPALTPFLSHRNPYVRMYTVETIGMIGFKRGTGTNYQLANLADYEPHEVVREMALEALLLNLDADAVASLREPKPPALPSPEPSAPVSPPLSEKNIASLLQMLKQETHRATALAILAERLQSDSRGALFVPMAMSNDRAVREIGMQALWNHSSPPGIAAPLAYAIHHDLGTAHHVELIDRINIGQSYAPYLIPYAMRSDQPRIRRAALKAWSRITNRGDWRKLLTEPWQYHDDAPHRRAIAAVNSLAADDVVVKAFITGGLRLPDESAFLKYVVSLEEATQEPEHAHDRLMAIYRAEKSLAVRRTILGQLSNEKPIADSPIPDLLVAVLTFEPERALRDKVVDTLRDFGRKASQTLPALLAKLQHEESTDSRMTIVEAIKVIGADNAELQAIIGPLEESLRIQHGRELLDELIAEQEKLKEITRRRQKRLLLRLLAN